MISGPFPCRSVYVKFVSWWVLFCLPCVFHFHSRWYKCGKPKAGIICKTKLHLNYKNFNFGLTMEDLELNARKWKTKIWPLLIIEQWIFILSSVRYAIQITPASSVDAFVDLHELENTQDNSIDVTYTLTYKKQWGRERGKWQHSSSYKSLQLLTVLDQHEWFPFPIFASWRLFFLLMNLNIDHLIWLNCSHGLASSLKFLSPFLGEISHLSIAHHVKGDASLKWPSLMTHLTLQYGCFCWFYVVLFVFLFVYFGVKATLVASDHSIPMPSLKVCIKKILDSRMSYPIYHESSFSD